MVVGGTGMLGGQVVTEILARGKQVRALVRVGSDASRLKAAGATIARGDSNAQWWLQGSTDIPLNDVGRRQARDAAGRLRGIG